MCRPSDIAHQLSIYGPTGPDALRTDPRTSTFMSSTKRLGRFVGEREDYLRPKLGPGTHLGTDGAHQRGVSQFIAGGEASNKSDWAKEPRLKISVLPEHTVGASYVPAPRSTLAPIIGSGYRRNVAANAKQVQAQEAALLASRAVPGPGAYEMPLAFERAIDTRLHRRGAVGLGISTQRRFTAQPEELEHSRSPPPGAYGEPRGRAREGGGVPRDPQVEWRREEAEGRLSPVFTAIPRDPTQPFPQHRLAPARNFKRLGSADRARVKAPGGLLVQPKKVAAPPVSGPGMYWTPSHQRAPEFSATPDVTSRRGTSAFLSPLRPSQRVKQTKPEVEEPVPSTGPKALKRTRPRGPSQAVAGLPECHFSLRREEQRWRAGGSGRSGYARNDTAALDYRTGAVVTSGPRPSCDSTLVSRRRYQAALEHDKEQERQFIKVLGFDPAADWERAMESISAASVRLDAKFVYK